MAELPPITLDRTLAELYRQASPKNADKTIAHILCGANSRIALSDDFPRNISYVYVDSHFIKHSREEPAESRKSLQRELAIKYLSRFPQRDAFLAGNSPVVFFHVDGSDEAQIAHDEGEVKATIESLDVMQRAKLVFCAGPAEIPVQENGIDLLSCKVVLDAVKGYQMTVDLNSHWRLNSKESLAKSGLPTPKCKFLELHGCADSAELCCDICQAEEDAYYIPQSCEGKRGQWLNSQIERFVAGIEKYPPPFVMKVQQAWAGAGTYLVKTEKERSEAVAELEGGLLRKLLSLVTPTNRHLKLGTILLSDMIEDPIENTGITLFITDTGGHIFIGACEQMIADGSQWAGSIIRYNEQERLKQKFAAISQHIATWLHSQGYWGPAGADILETRNTPMSETNGHDHHSKDVERETDFHIVDLNVRTTGSLALPLLRTHFTSRGLDCASSFSITVEASRDEFIESWKDDFELGRMCILSWYRDRLSGESIADLAIGAKNEKELQRFMAKVQDTSGDHEHA